MHVIKRDSLLWGYLSAEIRDLIEDGEIILNFVYANKNNSDISDYSFLVFPFAKAYEGFLKRFLLDIGLIREEDYYSDDIRIGRILNPGYQKQKGNIFARLCKKDPNVPRELWAIWKRGRNLVFHYFPHNYKKLSYDEALDIINDIVRGMHAAVTKCNYDAKK